MNKKSTRVLIALAIIVVSLYALFQALMIFSKPVKTEKLIEFTADDFILSDGFVMRKETIIKSTASGTPDYVISEGERVQKDSLIAVLYSGTESIATRNKINDLEKKIAQLQNSQSAKDLFLSDALKLETMIDDKLLAIAKINGSKKTAEMSKYSDELQLLLNKKQIILGQVKDFNEKIKALQDERDKLKGSFAGKFGNVTAPVSGFFSSLYDGYENLLDPEYLKKNGMTAYNEVYSLQTGSNKPNHYIGKIVQDFQIYYACVVKEKVLKDFVVGDGVKLQFVNAKASAQNAVIWNLQTQGEDTLAIFEINTTNAQLNNLRKEKVQIVTKSYTGYKVNKSAVRMQDKTTGIFVLVGTQIQFKPVKVLFSRDEYMVIVADTEKKSSLMPGEKVVLEGKELFDGKIVK